MAKVFIAIPAYDGRMHTQCALSLIAAIKRLELAGHNVSVYAENGKCYLPEARSLCVRKFTEVYADFLIFVDTDLAFDERALVNLVRHNRDLVFGAYPFKEGEGYPVRIHTNENRTPVVDGDGLLRAEGGPTGLMCIKRIALINIMEAHPEWTVDCLDGTKLNMVFDTGILIPDDKRWWGEDYLFCKRLEDAGCELWCEPRITFCHYGSKGTIGNYHEYLMSQPQPEKQTNKGESDGRVPGMASDGGNGRSHGLEPAGDGCVHQGVGRDAAFKRDTAI